MLNAAVRHLPLSFHLLAPELHELDLPEEAGSDCANCPMARPAGVAPDAPGRIWFDPEMRCCSYHPFIPNFLVGRALRRGGIGAERILARLEDREGITALGIEPTSAFNGHYTANRGDEFGRNVALRCPFWVPGPLACSIWHDRTATCRTWHCKHDSGVYGFAVWQRQRDLLRVIELTLGRWCVEALSAPEMARASVASLVDYYLKSCDLVERADVDDLQGLADDELVEARRMLRLMHQGLTLPVAEVLVPHLGNVEHLGDGRVRLLGYSPYDLYEGPSSVFKLFELCDGVRPWRDVLAALSPQYPELTEAEVVALARFRLLAPAPPAAAASR